MISDAKVLALIFTMALVTFFIRVAPFIIFSGKNTPQYITFLSRFLPSAIIGMLVVYCIKDISITSNPHGIPELISIAVVGLLHIYKRNTLVSIVAGTICYMLLVQLVFI